MADLDLSGFDEETIKEEEEELDLSGFDMEQEEPEEGSQSTREVPAGLSLAAHEATMGLDVPAAGLADAITAGAPGSPEFGKAFQQGVEQRQQGIEEAREALGPAQSILIGAATAAAPATLLKGGRIARTLKGSALGGGREGGLAASEGADIEDVMQAAGLGALGGGLGGLFGAGAAKVTPTSEAQKLRSRLSSLRKDYKKSTMPEVRGLIEEEALPLRMRMTDGTQSPTQAIESIRRTPQVIESDLTKEISEEFRRVQKSKSPEAAVRHIKDKIVPELEKSKEIAIKGRNEALDKLRQETSENVFTEADRAGLTDQMQKTYESLADSDKQGLLKNLQGKLDDALAGVDDPGITAADSLNKLQKAREILDEKIQGADTRTVKRALRELRSSITELMHSDAMKGIAPEYVASDAQFRRFYEGIEQAKKLGAGQYDELLPGKFAAYAKKTPEYEKGIARTRGEEPDLQELRRRAEAIRAQSPEEVPAGLPEASKLEELRKRVEMIRKGEIPEGLSPEQLADLELQRKFGTPLDLLATRDVSKTVAGSGRVPEQLAGIGALATTRSGIVSGIARQLVGDAFTEPKAIKLISNIAEAERRLADRGLDPMSKEYLSAIQKVIEASGVGIGSATAGEIARRYLREDDR